MLSEESKSVPRIKVLCIFEKVTKQQIQQSFPAYS